MKAISMPAWLQGYTAPRLGFDAIAGIPRAAIMMPYDSAPAKS